MQTNAADYINTDIILDSSIDVVEAQWKLVTIPSVTSYIRAFGSRVSFTQKCFAAQQSDSIYVDCRTEAGTDLSDRLMYAETNAYTTGAVIKVINCRDKRELYVNDEFVKGDYSSQKTFKTASTAHIFSIQGFSVSTNIFKFGYLKDLNGRFYIVPFIRNGVAGMIDLISGQFYGNAALIGSFTIITE